MIILWGIIVSPFYWFALFNFINLYFLYSFIPWTKSKIILSIRRMKIKMMMLLAPVVASRKRKSAQKFSLICGQTKPHRKLLRKMFPIDIFPSGKHLLLPKISILITWNGKKKKFSEQKRKGCQSWMYSSMRSWEKQLRLNKTMKFSLFPITIS